MDALFPYRKGKTEEIKANGIHMDAIREVILSNRHWLMYAVLRKQEMQKWQSIAGRSMNWDMCQ